MESGRLKKERAALPIVRTAFREGLRKAGNTFEAVTQRRFFRKQHVRHEVFYGSVQPGLNARVRRLGLRSAAELLTRCDNEIRHSGLMFQRHQDHNIAGGRQVSCRIKLARQTGQVLAARFQIQRPVGIQRNGISHVLNRTVRAGHIPSTPTVLDRRAMVDTPEESSSDKARSIGGGDRPKKQRARRRARDS
jgi:hypothetical protein